MRSVALLALLLLPGCAGRAAYFLVDATRTYREAVEAGAAADAPYEMALAGEYLKKAQEEAGYSDYEAAEKLARRASEEAGRALAITRENEVPRTDTTSVPDDAPVREEPTAAPSPTPVVDP